MSVKIDLVGRAVTHGGEFQANDVMAGALLRLLVPRITIHRTGDEGWLQLPLLDPSEIVFGVGGEFNPDMGNFDHYQRLENPMMRQNGAPISSFGLLWNAFGLEYCARAIKSFDLESYVVTASLWALVDSELVEGIDAIDCNMYKDLIFRPKVGKVEVEIATFAQALYAMNPQPLLYGRLDYSECYRKALMLAEHFLKGFVEKSLAKLYGQQLIRNAHTVSHGRIMVVGQNIPDWSDVVSKEFPGALYYLEPDSSDKSGYAYTIRQVPTEPRGFVGRLPLPKAWAGLRGKELAVVTQIKGASFCHNTQIVGGAKSREAAIQMAVKAIQIGLNE